MPLVGCLGDLSDHGGTIITASSGLVCCGRPTAVTGDLHSCPIPGHGITQLTAPPLVNQFGMGFVTVGQSFAGCGAVITTGSPMVDAT